LEAPDTQVMSAVSSGEETVTPRGPKMLTDEGGTGMEEEKGDVKLQKVR